MQQWLTLFFCLALMNAGRVAARGDDVVDFSSAIAPLLEQRCVRCHSGTKAKGGLSLASKSAILRGGENGPAIVIGKPDDSLLIDHVSGAKPSMPAEGAPLTKAETGLLRAWITAGASWPEDLTLQERPTDQRSWWSYQPIRRSASPQVTHSEWRRNEIDSFVLAKLEEEGLHPSDEADRRTMIRRLSFDLLGLPPTAEEIAVFENDSSTDAIERLLDRFLASPHYGERWARHWLDIAHYADTHGFERDQRRDNAWRYRDWVIRALNSDLPYDQYLRDQIAGDVLRPEDPDAIIATGFLAAGPWDFVGQAETPSLVLKRLARADDLDDMVTQIMTATCGVTINCARCHDHKLDPISQREYYSLWAVFAGVKRAERDVSPTEVQELATRRQTLNAELQEVHREIARRSGERRDLADIVGGGNGLGTGKSGVGVDPLSGRPQIEKRGFLEGARTNVFARSTVKFIDGVVIPDLSPEGTQIASTGLKILKTPRTSGQVWDAIRFGPVNSQFSTKLDGVDYAADGHTLLSLHANVAITFDLAALRDAGASAELKFTATVGYFGKTPKDGASFSIYVDGEQKAGRRNIGRDDGGIAVEVILPSATRFLTLMSTDGGNGIGHDQICFADPWLIPAEPEEMSDVEKEELVRLKDRRTLLEKQITSIPPPQKVYGIVTESPPVVKILKRGDPEQPSDAVVPGAIACVSGIDADLGEADSTDGQRRTAFANWLTSAKNPLPCRVLVNRVWRHHFGSGIVETPSDFGAGGSLPSHPELLDWLADEFHRNHWSLKSIHRLICASATYRQCSSGESKNLELAKARHQDSANRLLWRMNPRRLDAESLRDSILCASGSLNLTLYGPGYRDFEYQEEYAPVYRYVTSDNADLWRRSIYRFAVRTTTQQFLTTLDCPSPANLVPVRNTTTTALQSLALLNNDFVIRQSQHFADQIRRETGSDERASVNQAFRNSLGRLPTPSEREAALVLLKSHGLVQLCRMLMNSNEFVYID